MVTLQNARRRDVARQKMIWWEFGERDSEEHKGGWREQKAKGGDADAERKRGRRRRCARALRRTAVVYDPESESGG